MSFEDLKDRVRRSNLALVEAGLVVLTWGNASGVDRDEGVMAIKPSGVGYDKLRPEDMVIVSLENGERVAIETLHLKPDAKIPGFLHQKHFERRYGPDAYYGQEKK